MDTIQFIRQMIAAARQQIDDAMVNTALEQFNWAPPGTANPISAVFIHMNNSEDFFIQTVLQAKSKLWDSGNWGEKTGVKNTPDYGGNWDEFKQMTLELEPVLAFQHTVRASTDSYLERLTVDMLERKVKIGDDEDTIAGILILLARHTLYHAGEISALKGVQGGKGLQY